MNKTSTRSAPVDPARRIDTQWKRLLPAATVVMGAIGNFWHEPPPGLDGDSSRAVAYFGQFIVTVLIGLMVLPMMKWCCRRTHAVLWAKIAVIALVAGIVAFFTYQHLSAEWTFRHRDRVLYIGDEVRDDVKEFIRHNPDLARHELLEFAGWDPRNIWSEESLHRRRLILSAVYILCTPLFAITIMAVAQVVYCARSRE